MAAASQDTAGPALASEPGEPGERDVQGQPRQLGGSLVIAVDGPSGSGKSTAARGVATALDLRYLDTGAMYRALTWWMLEHDVDVADTEAVVTCGLDVRIEVGTDPAAPFTKVDGIDVTAQIRQRQVSNAVSLVAAIPPVRRHLIAQQQAIIAQALAHSTGIVAEGRDIGTVVAPHASVKVFLTASEQARAERRTAELVADEAAAPDPAAAPGAAKGTAGAVSADLTRREQATRDRLDAPQSQRAADAIEVDATELDVTEVIALIIGLARSRRATS
jgi:cytidylate kinase